MDVYSVEPLNCSAAVKRAITNRFFCPEFAGAESKQQLNYLMGLPMAAWEAFDHREETKALARNLAFRMQD